MPDTTGLPHQIPFLESGDPPSIHGISQAIAEQVAVRLGSAGKSIIAGAETRTNTAFGLLTTPDRVQGIVLPTDGLLLIAAQMQWKESVIGAGRAGLFLGSNQIVQAQGGSIGPNDAFIGGTDANVYRPLWSTNYGLESTPSSGPSDYIGDVTTGQAVGGVTTGTTRPGGLCVVFAAAGTYDVSVRFRATSGSVTAMVRRLWVRALPF